MECLAPENTGKKPVEEFEQTKKSLREKLELIEHPIVLTGDIHRSPVFNIPSGTHYPILMSEEIAANCITATRMTMERVASEELISHYETGIWVVER